MMDFTDKNIPLDIRKDELMKALYTEMNGSPFSFPWNEIVSMNQLIQSMNFEEDFLALLHLLALINLLGYNEGCKETYKTIKKVFDNH